MDDRVLGRDWRVLEQARQLRLRARHTLSFFDDAWHDALTVFLGSGLRVSE